jgi:hypothetical protein
MKLAVAATVALAALTGCNRGFSPDKSAKQQQQAPLPETVAATPQADSEVQLAIEPDQKVEEIEPAGRADGENADDAHGKWVTTAKDKGLNLSGLSGPSVREEAVPYAQLDTEAEIPVWTRQQLLAGFSYLRDIMLSKADGKGHSRRLTWLYPDDGCYARAALGGYLLGHSGYKRPFNVFSFGNLSAKTANHPQGFVAWRYHVAPIVEVESVAFVLDPAIEPKRPLTLREWLERQAPSAESLKVSLCDAGSMNPNGLCRGGADPAKAALGYIKQNFFDLEEKRQQALGRDPAIVLGLNPPWRPAAKP